MKVLQKFLMAITLMGLLTTAAGCGKPLDLNMLRNRIFLLGRLLVGETCDVRVIWRKAPEDPAPLTVTADLSQIGGNVAQELTATENGTWRWIGQVVPDSAGEKIITITARNDQGALKAVRNKFRVFDTGKAVAIAKHEDLSLAVKADGTVVAWDCPGDYDPYQHNRGQCTVPEDITDAVAVAAGYGFGVVLKGDGTVRAWGEYESVESYDPYYVSSWQKMEVPEGLNDVVAIDASHKNAIALKADGTLVVWGNNGRYQCNIPKGVTDIVGVAAGNDYAVALKADGTIAAWYWLGSKYKELKNVVAVSTYQIGTLALHSDGYIEAVNVGSSTPLRMGGGFTAISSFSGFDGVGLRRDGIVTVWWQEAIEPYVIEGLRNIVAISRTMALAEDGSVISFSPNLYGFEFKPVPEDLQ